MDRNKNRKYDVIIPVGPNDVNFTHRVVDYVWRCLFEAEHIYIITNKNSIKKIKKRIPGGIPVTFVDENSLVEGLSFKRIKELLTKYSEPNAEISVGWYLQQFIKFAFARSKYAKSFYLSWDADTLPLAPIKYFEGDNILFNPKHEYNKNYFSTIEKILGYGRLVNYSFISENMLFSVDYVENMLQEIENRSTGGLDWIEFIISSCNLQSPLPAFSEFETYGNYCVANYPGVYKKRHLNTFREAGYIAGRYISEDKLKEMSFDLDTASFEIRHLPAYPYRIYYYFDIIKIKYIKLSKMSINDLCQKIRDKIYRNQKNKKREIEEIMFRLPITADRIKPIE